MCLHQPLNDGKNRGFDVMIGRICVAAWVVHYKRHCNCKSVQLASTLPESDREFHFHMPWNMLFSRQFQVPHKTKLWNFHNLHIGKKQLTRPIIIHLCAYTYQHFMVGSQEIPGQFHVQAIWNSFPACSSAAQKEAKQLLRSRPGVPRRPVKGILPVKARRNWCAVLPIVLGACVCLEEESLCRATCVFAGILMQAWMQLWKSSNVLQWFAQVN